MDRTDANCPKKARPDDCEHRALLEAALAHDADRTVMLFEAHIERTQALVIDSIDDPQAKA